MCVSLQSELSQGFGFTPLNPLLSGHCALPFNFSPPRGGYKPFWKLLSISNFSAWLPRKKNQLIRKKALWGFQTGWDKDWSIYTSGRCCLCSVSLQRERLMSLRCSIKTSWMGHFNFKLITLDRSGAKKKNPIRKMSCLWVMMMVHVGSSIHPFSLCFLTTFLEGKNGCFSVQSMQICTNELVLVRWCHRQHHRRYKSYILTLEKQTFCHSVKPLVFKFCDILCQNCRIS